MARRSRWLPTAIGLLAVAGVAAGCDDTAQTVGDGSAGLASAWQAQPMRVAADITEAAVRACRASGAGAIPQTSTAVVADARGDSRIAVVFAGPREQVFLCLLRVAEDGSLVWSTGWGGDRHSAEGPLGPGEIRPERPVVADVSASASGPSASPPSASAPASTITTATGRFGRSVAGVTVTLASGDQLIATAAGGWYAAWWPNDNEVSGYQAISVAGQPLGPAQH